MLSLGLIGLLGTGSAEARSDPYYEELLAKTKGIDSGDLLSKYQQSQSAKGKKGKVFPMKEGSVNKNATALKGKKNTNGAKKTATPNVRAKSAAASTGVFNAVEVGLGLAGVAGVVAIGQSSSKGGSKKEKAPQRSQNRAPPAKKSLPKPSPKKAPRAPAVGTVRLSPGTKQIKPKTKKVGTVQKPQTKKIEAKETKSTSSVLPALLVGFVALVGAGSILGSKPDIKEVKQVSSVPEPEKIKERASEPIPESPPQAVAPKVTAASQTTQPAPQPSTEGKVKTPKLPPTTGNSPLVIIGGSIVALIAAAAVGGGSETTSGGDSREQSSSQTPALDDAAARSKEAREWIASWRAKQK